MNDYYQVIFLYFNNVTVSVVGSEINILNIKAYYNNPSNVFIDSLWYIVISPKQSYANKT